MADRQEFFYRQLVDETDLNGAFDKMEAAERAIITDLGLVGISSGYTLSPAAIPNLTVKVGAGTTYDASGQRVRLANEVSLDCSLDENGVLTAVQTPGNSRVLSIFVAFRRLQQDPQVDGNSATVYYQQPESYQLYVVAGVEAASSPTPPPLNSSRILLGDVTLIYGQTAINTGDISSARRQWTFKTTSGTQVAVGTVMEAVQLLADAIGALVGLSDDTGPDDGATRVGNDAISGATYSVTRGTVKTALVALFAAVNAEAVARAGVQTNLTNFISALAAAAGGASVGGAAQSGTPSSLSAGSIQAQIIALLGLVNARARLASTETVSGNWNFTGDLTLEGKITTHALVSGAVQLLMIFPVWNGSAYRLRLYTTDVDFAGIGPSLLLTWNASWDGTKWMPDVAGQAAYGLITDGSNITIRINSPLGAGGDTSLGPEFVKLNSSGVRRGTYVSTAAGPHTTGYFSGQVRIKAGTSSVVINNALFTSTCTPHFNMLPGVLKDATLTDIWGDIQSGTLTIYGNANATADVRVSFSVEVPI